MPEPERSAPRPPSVPIRLGSLNVVLLLGRVTMDPDLRYTPSGAAVLGFRIAVDRVWRDKATDEWKREASFFQVNLWGQAAERLSKTMRKGSAVLVEGQLRSRSWEGKDGEKRYVVEIHSSRTQVLDKPDFTSGPAAGPAEEEPDVPRDQLDDIPF
ncbi:single-stranded DNA-binding protein [candidate division WOR-3 bacterium]|nr:single-stranded DNA-binding protein [candidate division WOR-3 bacterium]